MSDWLFDTPWWLPTLIIAIGAFLLWNGNRRTNSRMKMAGAGVCMLAVLLVMISTLVNTPRERAIAGSKKLVASFENSDWAGFESVLAPNVSLTMANFPGTIYSNRDQLLAAARHAQDEYKFKSARILSISADQAETLISVNLELMTVQDATMDRPITSAWRFEWQEAKDGWALERIVALRIANEPVERVHPMFPNAGK